MNEIRLQRGRWTYDESKLLGPPGGFGTVYLGFSPNGDEVAVKRLHKDASELAHREMEIADKLIGREFNHVLPFLDAGLDPDTDSYFLVMPKAEKDLKVELGLVGKFDEDKAVPILKEIISGLLEIPELVHRDLKPANILFHEGKWKIADFGIARFVEEATSSQTLKGCLSYQYAAPEQWQYLHATNATDIYSLGCIGYALLTGSPPFSGPEESDYKDQHLNQSPPTLSDTSSRLRSLLSIMLRKEPETRPDLIRVEKTLKSLEEAGRGEPPRGAGFDALARAGAADAELLSHREAEEARVKSEQENRSSIAKQGFVILHEILQELVDAIREGAPTAVVNEKAQECRIALGMGILEWKEINTNTPIPRDAFSNCRWDVVAGIAIRVIQNTPRGPGWGSNLWYLKREHEESFRWNEVAYMDLSLAQRRRQYIPFEILSFEDADYAASHITHIYQIAYGPKFIDDEDKEDFIERWLERLSKASEGRLQLPNRLPIK